MKTFLRFSVVVAMLMAICQPTKAQGWPANYQGVMLQGFYWDSYSDSSWANLTAQADELSKYFSLIWVPNSGKCAYMGYMPQYWFTNHNSAFGSESELRNMINTFKSKGTGIIEDVVINHRNGVTNWYDFPVEVWNGTTWQIGLDGICRNDEMASASGQPTPTGNYDTGDNFDGCRDLDHTNANVQNSCKNYCKFLLEDLGYAGFRLDMVKGYSGTYTKIYNEYSRPKFCVGEYWDGSYDAVAGWIESTGKTSAAFDFPCKYAMNDAFSSGDMTKLVWKANGTNPQPAGLIHFGYPRYAVTFIDNHDTYRDGYNRFNGNVEAANAFILCSPGTPCVFLKHYMSNKAAIQRLISIRNSVGIHNLSAVNVLTTNSSCYMAEVTGFNGKLVVKIGPAMVSPSGYSDSDIVASGTDYCVWTKTTIVDGGSNRPVNPGTPVDIYFDNSNSNWTTPYIHYWGGDESAWPGVAMENVEENIWHYTCPAGTTGVLFNAGDGKATQTADFVAYHNHIYTTSGDQGVYDKADQGGGGDQGGDQGGGSTVTLPSLYLLGDLAIGVWTTNSGIKLEPQGDHLIAKEVEFTTTAADGMCYFAFVTTLGADWDAVNSSDRYGAAFEGDIITPGVSAPIYKYAVGVDASACKSWTVAQGIYDIDVNWAEMTVTLSKSISGVTGIETEDNVAPVYYNLQGIEVKAPTSGIYIVRRGNNVSKETVR